MLIKYPFNKVVFDENITKNNLNVGPLDVCVVVCEQFR